MLRHELPKELFKEASDVGPYPDSVAKIRKMLPVTAFFPGGKGLWEPEDDGIDAFPRILVLGQDFGTEADLQKMWDRKQSDLDCATWKNLIPLFEEAGIGLCDCFFSNVFLGVRRTKSAMGKCPGFRDKEFTKRNLHFLKRQIEIIEPRVIMTLGFYAAKMLADLSPECLSDWSSARRFKDIRNGRKEDVRIGDLECTCVCLVHPCMRHVNVRQRVYGGYEGHCAEKHMLRDAVGC